MAENKGAQGAYAPGPAKEAPKGGAVIFGGHGIYKNFVSSVDAGMGMEGQIMRVKQCTF